MWQSHQCYGKSRYKEICISKAVAIGGLFGFEVFDCFESDQLLSFVSATALHLKTSKKDVFLADPSCYCSEHQELINAVRISQVQSTSWILQTASTGYKWDQNNFFCPKR